jgi:Flp pilus assembly pilin Flp
MDFSPRQLAALAIATSFAAGLNVYATVATLGLLARFQVIELPASLGLLSDGWVIGGASALFLVEFVADKVPLFDLVWNALQTLVRVPVAALLAYGATSHLSPGNQLLTAAAGAVVAFIAHGGKLAARVAVTPSPEPFSNIALSFGEDAFAIFLTWFATEHPFLAAAIAIVLVVAMVAVVSFVVGALRDAFRGAPRPAASAAPNASP